MEGVGARAANVADRSGVPFDEFYRNSWKQTVRVAALLTQDRSVAEEIAQEAFVAVFDRWSQLREPEGYLYRCVSNAGKMYHRRVGTERRKLPLLDPPPFASVDFDELADVVATLPFRQRAVIVLRYHARLSESEIADALGCRPGTVKSLASRALRRMKRELS
jgi:RNA polymerase sigma factor (sigma-70 family)